jgi:transcriptional regulator with XRE-family HTH domain
MSFDDGVTDNFDVNIKAALKAAMSEEGVTWPELCSRAGVSESEAQHAVELGTNGLPQSLPLLQRLSLSLGRDANWLLTGNDKDGVARKLSQSEQAKKVVWEYIYNAEVPRSEWALLVAQIDNIVASLTCSTPQAAFRRGLPRTWTDVAWMHQRILRSRPINGAR